MPSTDSTSGIEPTKGSCRIAYPFVLTDRHVGERRGRPCLEMLLLLGTYGSCVSDT